MIGPATRLPRPLDSLFIFADPWLSYYHNIIKIPSDIISVIHLHAEFFFLFFLKFIESFFKVFLAFECGALGAFLFKFHSHHRKY